jgi:hypothetical protein
MEDFERWLNDLDLQTLTDELKEEIIERVQIVHEDAYGEGFGDAKGNMLDYLDSI